MRAAAQKEKDTQLLNKITFVISTTTSTTNAMKLMLTTMMSMMTQQFQSFQTMLRNVIVTIIRQSHELYSQQQTRKRKALFDDVSFVILMSKNSIEKLSLFIERRVKKSKRREHQIDSVNVASINITTTTNKLLKNALALDQNKQIIIVSNNENFEIEHLESQSKLIYYLEIEFSCSKNSNFSSSQSSFSSNDIDFFTFDFSTQSCSHSQSQSQFQSFTNTSSLITKSLCLTD